MRPTARCAPPPPRAQPRARTRHTACTQRVHRAHAPPAHAPGAHSAPLSPALARPPVLAPRWATRRRLKGGATRTPKPLPVCAALRASVATAVVADFAAAPARRSSPSPPPRRPVCHRHRDRRGRHSRHLTATEPPPLAATAVNAVAPTAPPSLSPPLPPPPSPWGARGRAGGLGGRGVGRGEVRGVDSTPFGPRPFFLACLFTSLRVYLLSR